MRQKDEKEFIDLLNRIRIGMPTDDDIALLNTLKLNLQNPLNKIKESALFYHNLLKEGKSLIALFPKNEDVENFNIEMSKLNNINFIKVEAEDIVRQKVSQSKFQKKDG